MKIVVFTFIRYSHIIPILPLLRQICANADNMVTIFCKKEYTYLFQEFKCELLFYHDNYMENYIHAKKQEEFKEKNIFLRKKISEFYYEKKETESLEKEYLKNHFIQSILGMVNEETQSLERYNKFINDLEPDLIIRDSIELIGLYYGKKKNIPVHSYITNNIYSLEFLKNSEKESFLGYFQLLEQDTFNINNEKRNNLLAATEEAYLEVSHILNNDSIYPAFQQAPQEKICFICSSPQIHPPIFLGEKTDYIFLGNSFNEKEFYNVSKSEIEFIAKAANSRKGYLSYGSYIKIPIETIVSEIREILNYTDHLIVSCPKSTLSMISILLSEKEKQQVLLKEGVNQKYILANVDFFISSGGWNSIKEAIAYEVPLIINPLFSEQILNGKMIIDLEIGISFYHSKYISKNYTQVLESYFNKYELYKENIKKLNTKLQMNQYPSIQISNILENLS
ncbi:hypothetical protein JZO79_11635 [Vagococcus fluvialis]|uniref:hypothetical protein n=1 Tax=Vagococcus fluvialis TaxID=2738 RepID=UPI001A8F41F6|nr:hypothetical protein [Vagococcus fluvialis]MBO0444264.1 hypothetical protein [Vagococcus fluvialis]